MFLLNTLTVLLLVLWAGMWLWKKSGHLRSRYPDIQFHYKVFNQRSEIENDVWYRLCSWNHPSNYLRMEREALPDWRSFSPQEELVAGTDRDNRWEGFLLIAGKPGFEMFFEKEPDSVFDRCSIRVMGTAMIDGSSIVVHLGDLSKETAFLLKDEQELKAGSASILLPTDKTGFSLNVQILERSSSYRLKRKTQSGKMMESPA